MINDDTSLNHPLNNPIWHALTNQQAPLALGQGRARRYQQDISSFVGVAANDEAAFGELAALIPAGDVALLVGGQPVIGDTWALLRELFLIQMVYDGPAVEAVPAKNVITPLTHADVPAMLELVDLTHPGPFLPRTIDLGSYLAIRQGDQIAAMAGERFHLPGYREISAVCTHPSFQRRGYARELILQLVQKIQGAGDVPFLHVVGGNSSALALYESMGFKQRAELPLSVLKRQ